MPTIPYIQTVQLTRTFGRTYALHRVDLRFDAGQLHVLMGPNGAGKSTLLAILATLDRPSSGEVHFGATMGSPQMADRGRGLIGWLSHDSLVYGDLTGLENLLFYARLYRLNDPEVRAADWLQQVGISAAAQRPVRAYSRGMRQRLSLARAMIHEPEVLCLDEPFTGLDPEGRRRVIDLLFAARERGCLIVLSTHAHDLPLELIDQAVVLRGARVRYAGPAEAPLADIYGAAVADPSKGG